MRFQAVVRQGWIVLSMYALGTSPPARFQSFTASEADPKCDTLAVPAAGLVTLVAPGPNGAVAWTEGPRATEVRVRTSGGEIRTIGRNGAGPGEFRIVSALGWRGDTLWADDVRLSRVSGFAAGTTLLRVVTLPQPGVFLPRDDKVFIGVVLPVPAPGHSLELGSGTLAIAVIDPGTGALQTLLSIDPANNTELKTLPAFYPARIARANGDATLWCLTASGNADSTQLACVTGAGQVAFHKNLWLAPHPLSATEWDRSVNAFAEQMHTTATDVLQQFAPQRALTAAFDLLINGRSEFWLLRTPPSDLTARWERYAITGRLLADAVLPGRLQLRALAGDVAYAADTDQDGLQALVRCRLPVSDHHE